MGMKDPTFYHRSTIAESRFPFFATLYYTERTFAAVQINFINSHMHTRGEFDDSLQRDDLSIEEKVRSSGVKSLYGRAISLASNNTCVSRYLDRSRGCSNIHERTNRTSISDALATRPRLRYFPPNPVPAL